MLKALFNRRLTRTLAWVLVIAAAAVGINVLGIRIIGTADGWSRWLTTHRAYFLAWRLCLYAATAWGWWWMRQRVRQREPSKETHARLLRTEIAAVMAILALEGAVLLTLP